MYKETLLLLNSTLVVRQQCIRYLCFCQKIISLRYLLRTKIAYVNFMSKIFNTGQSTGFVLGIAMCSMLTETQSPCKDVVSCVTGIFICQQITSTILSNFTSVECGLWSVKSSQWKYRGFFCGPRGGTSHSTTAHFPRIRTQLTWIYLSSFHVIFWVVLCVKQKLR